ncbi:MAG TPA: class I SAM-dependent methyltransferase [archaeon]|nr:class I SAM-dependent methyltransferase [archaeon]
MENSGGSFIRLKYHYNLMVIKKSGDQESYLNRGTYDKALRNFPPAYLSYHQREEWFFRDNVRVGSNVLDVGCGELRTIMPLAVHVGAKGKVVGIDFNQRSYENAKRKAEVFKNVEILKLDARELNELPYEFDFILFPFELLGLLEIKDQVPVLRKARGKLKPRGKILATVFSEYAPSAQFEMYQLLWGPRAPRVNKNYVYGGDGYKAETFTKYEIAGLFSRAGLKPEVRELTRMAYSVRAVA